MHRETCGGAASGIPAGIRSCSSTARPSRRTSGGASPVRWPTPAGTRCSCGTCPVTGSRTCTPARTSPWPPRAGSSPSCWRTGGWTNRWWWPMTSVGPCRCGRICCTAPVTARSPSSTPWRWPRGVPLLPAARPPRRGLRAAAARVAPRPGARVHQLGQRPGAAPGGPRPARTAVARRTRSARLLPADRPGGPDPHRRDPGPVRGDRHPGTGVLGRGGRLDPPGQGAELADRIPDARFEPIAGAGHLVQEDAPAELTAILLDFLRDQTAGPG